MTNQAIIRDLRNPCGKGYVKANTLERSLTAGVEELEECQQRATIWEILFTPPWRKNDGQASGAKMRPLLVNTPGGSYAVTDNQRSLAFAAHAGPVSTLAEVWRNTIR